MAPRPPAPLSTSNPQPQRNGTYFVTKAEVPCTVKKPSWQGKKTVFRPHPSARHDDPTKAYPHIVDPAGKSYFGWWLRQVYCAWGIGTNGITFLIDDGGDASMFNPYDTPLGVLNSAINQACKQGQGMPEWHSLLMGGANKGKALRGVTMCYMMQGMLLEHDGKLLYSNNQVPPGAGDTPPCVLMLSQSTGAKMIEMMNLQNPDYKGDPSDLDKYYVNGDVVGFDSGRYITLFQAGHDPRTQQQVASRPGSFMSTKPQPGFVGQARVGTMDDKGYEMFFSDSYLGTPAVYTKEDADRALAKWVHWDDLLYFPNEVEQARMLGRVFPPSAIEYAFADRQEWISDEVRSRLVNRTTMAPQQGIYPGSHWMPPQQGHSVPVHPGHVAGGYVAGGVAAPWGAPAQPSWGAPTVAGQPVQTPVVGEPLPTAQPDPMPAQRSWGATPASASVPVDPSVPTGTMPPFGGPPAIDAGGIDPKTAEMIARMSAAAKKSQ